MKQTLVFLLTLPVLAAPAVALSSPAVAAGGPATPPVTASYGRGYGCGLLALFTDCPPF